MPSKRMRIESTPSNSSNCLSNSHAPSSLARPTTPSNSNSNPTGDQQSGIEQNHSFRTNNGELPSASDTTALREHHRRATSNNTIPDLYNPRPGYQQVPDHLHIPQQNMGTLANFHPLYFDNTQFGNFSPFDSAIPSMPTAIYGTAGSQVNQGNQIDNHNPPLDRARIRPISRIGFVMPGTPQIGPERALGNSPSAEPPAVQGCRYLVLVPLLQHINSVIPTSIACDLLDFYFAEPSSSLFESASPYILTHIFRKKSFLHPTKPRVTSPALLTAMLWATAQTSDAQIFKTSPTSRARICDRLFAICLRLLNPLLYENPRKVSGGLASPSRQLIANVDFGRENLATGKVSQRRGSGRNTKYWDYR